MAASYQERISHSTDIVLPWVTHCHYLEQLFPLLGALYIFTRLEVVSQLGWVECI